AADPAALQRLPIAVKVSNAPACVRPQFGLAAADVVFEHYVEAWATRLTAIYHSQAPAKVGPVRSARLLDLELPAIFGAGLLYSGASAGVAARIAAADFADRALDQTAGCPPLCRVTTPPLPCDDPVQSLFADVGQAQAPDTFGNRGLAGRGYRQPLFPLAGWVFSPEPSGTGRPASVIDIAYVSNPLRWRFDPAAGGYLRAQTGRAHTDAASGLTLAAANVVLLYANHVYSDVQESTFWYSLEIQFWGEGPALLLRDGQAFEGRWQRPAREGLFALVDAAGDPLPLKPGQTWFEMVGLETAVSASDGRLAVDPQELPQQTPP
ncbi:MAG: DUF3048 domain-containing protein, partial [Chloroflexi bacterium]|nr:DUF3048 domain-containing protein [Chloroflexota bacterium]